jgi:hypothetical protein
MCDITNVYVPAAMFGILKLPIESAITFLSVPVMITVAPAMGV